MKILLDENIPAKMKFEFDEGYEVRTVGDMGWLGKKNGELLSLAVSNGFKIFIILDKNLKNQQSLNRFDIIFILLIAKDNKHQTLQPYTDKIKNLVVSDKLKKLNEIMS